MNSLEELELATAEKSNPRAGTKASQGAAAAAGSGWAVSSGFASVLVGRRLMVSVFESSGHSQKIHC